MHYKTLVIAPGGYFGFAHYPAGPPPTVGLIAKLPKDLRRLLSPDIKLPSGG